MSAPAISPMTGAPLTHQQVAALEEIKATSTERQAMLRREIDAIQGAAVDARVITRGDVMGFTALPNIDGTLPPTERVVLDTMGGRLALLRGAHEQFADKCGIPWRYYERLLTDYPEGLVDHANHWLHTTPDAKLLRMLKPITDDDKARLDRTGAVMAIRAFLGPNFRALDNASLLNTLLGVAEEVGAFVVDYHLGEKRFHLRMTTDPRSTAEITQALIAEGKIARGEHKFVNENISFGVTVRNSETGHSLLAVDPWALILRCINGLIAEERVGVRHVGRERDEDAEAWSLDTRALDDAAIFLKVRDMTRRCFAEKSMQRVARAISEGAEAVLPFADDVPLFEIVESVGRRFDLTDGEVEVLKEQAAIERSVEMQSPQNDAQRIGAPTRWMLSQAMTATAREVGARGGDNNYERKVDMERMGWTILTDPVSSLTKSAARRLTTGGQN